MVDDVMSDSSQDVMVHLGDDPMGGAWGGSP